jgi:hypothetical protein
MSCLWNIFTAAASLTLSAAASGLLVLMAGLKLTSAWMPWLMIVSIRASRDAGNSRSLY